MSAQILLVTTWDTACGIAENSAYLKDAVETQSDLKLQPSSIALDPPAPHFYPIVHLNYHAALHSRWTPDEVQACQSYGSKVVITYHDTGVPNSDQCKALHAVADRFVIHEPADDLPGAIYLRMGVSSAVGPMQFGRRNWHEGEDDPGCCFKAYDAQPVLGTIGFPFGWKNYDQLAQITRDLGWALVLIAPNATEEQVATWRATNPDSWIRTDFVPRREAQSILTGCDATAFTYVCHNTGQSAAILQGIAARKPVIALKMCRQFRALYADPLGRSTIKWAETFDDVAAYLRTIRIQRIDPGIVALAEQESWKSVGQQYIRIYEELLGR